MNIQLAITIWNGTNSSSMAGNNIRSLNHAKLLMNLISDNRSVGLVSQTHWTSNTIFDKHSYPLIPFKSFVVDAQMNTISSALGRQPTETLSYTKKYDSDNKATTDFNVLVNELLLMSSTGSYSTGTSVSQNVGDHSVEGCFYMAGWLLNREKYGSLDRWPAYEDSGKHRGGGLVPLDKIDPSGAKGYQLRNTFEYSGLSLRNALRSLGFK